MPNAIQYAKYKEKWNNDINAHLKEKQRVNEAVKNKYKNDLEYREKCINYQKGRRIKKEELLTTATATTTF
jgi:hypothetical protein